MLLLEDEELRLESAETGVELLEDLCDELDRCPPLENSGELRLDIITAAPLFTLTIRGRGWGERGVEGRSCEGCSSDLMRLSN